MYIFNMTTNTTNIKYLQYLGNASKKIDINGKENAINQKLFLIWDGQTEVYKRTV